MSDQTNFSIEGIVEAVGGIVFHQVEFPAELKINSKLDSLGWLLTIEAAQPDLGRIIGRKGSTIDALRDVVHSIAQRHNTRITIKVLSPPTSV